MDRASREGIPVNLYVHPWEIDPDQPRIPAGWKSRFRHYTNLSAMEGKLREVLTLRKFIPFAGADVTALKVRELTQDRSEVTTQ